MVASSNKIFHNLIFMDYHTVKNFGSKKVWRMPSSKRFGEKYDSPKFLPPIFLATY